MKSLTENLNPLVNPAPSQLALFDLPRKNGTANKLNPDDRPVHEWYRFVLSFPPHLVRDYLKKFNVGCDAKVLDPFCGTGTTIVECKKLGVPAIGLEATLTPHFASMVKVNWAPDPDGLFKHAKSIADKVLKVLSDENIDDEPTPRNKKKTSNLRTLSPDAYRLLLSNSIDPLPLHKTLTLIDAIKSNKNDQYFNHEILAVAKALVSRIGNLEFGPEIGVGPPKLDVAVVSAWLSLVEGMARDLNLVRELKGSNVEVIKGDSRNPAQFLSENSVDAVFTSPPYPNEKDYTRTTRLESVVLGLIRDKAELRALKQGLIRSNTRNVYKNDQDDDLVADHPEIQRIASEIENRRIELGKTSGFERLYPKVTKLYFGGMAKHLAELRTVLKPGARLGYVVGDQASYLRIMIRTGNILASIAESLNYEVESIDLFRTRLATATREQLREEVLVLRWPGFKNRRSRNLKNVDSNLKES